MTLDRPRTPASPGSAPQGPSPMPRFSSEFVEEVQSCPDVDAFRAMLSRRRLWMNRTAAEEVYRYLKKLGSESLSDEELGEVTGGVAFVPGENDALRTLLDELSQQMG